MILQCSLNTIYILCIIYSLYIFIAYNIGYEDEIIEVISNLHIQGAKFGRKKDQFGGKS